MSTVGAYLGSILMGIDVPARLEEMTVSPLLLALSSAAFSSNYLLQAKHRSRLRIGNLDSKLGRMQSKFG